jgi:hypothetical protein
VGKWTLDRTCAAIVRAVTEAKLPQLLPFVLPELVGDNDAMPSGWDPADPCATALPPTKHSHTFWPDGRFNSYDQNEQQVDRGRWTLMDVDTVKIGDPRPRVDFRFSVEGDKLSLTPVIEPGCTTGACLEDLSWQFAVAFPGERWTRERSGPNVP